MRTEKTIYILLVLFAFLVMVGFYMVFDKLATLSTSVANTEIALQMKNQSNTTPQAPAPSEIPSSVPTSTPPEPEESGIAISSAILFETSSNATLAPQSPLTVTIERATKLPNGTVRVGVKVFTAQAASYTAIAFDDLIQVLNLDGNNQKATQVIGSFSSMPPKSAVSGALLFTLPTDKNTLILQVGSGDAMKFYEFDFGKKTYRETVIG
ncbi:MAG: hypothetical protein WCW78_01810 [Candidatus Paceibacterota bacterium]|jgi:hypothetical protein